jgi:hypothetical protein
MADNNTILANLMHRFLYGVSRDSANKLPYPSIWWRAPRHCFVVQECNVVGNPEFELVAPAMSNNIEVAQLADEAAIRIDAFEMGYGGAH